MRSADRFEHTQRWGSSDEDSGVRVRSTPVTAFIPPLKQTSYTATARLAPLARESKPRPPPSIAAPVRTLPLSDLRELVSCESHDLNKTIKLPSRIASSSPPPAVAAAPAVHPSVHAAVHAAVHASVQASVEAMLASAHAWRAPQEHVEAASPAPPVPASAWTPAQRFYVLATSVALAVVTTLLLQIALGGPVVATAAASPSPSPSTRAARVPTIASAASAKATGSAPRKDPAFVTAEAAAVAQLVARRAPVGSAGISVGSSARTSAVGGPTSGSSASSGPSGSPQSAKLDEAARSAKMLRDQLSTAVN